MAFYYRSMMPSNNCVVMIQQDKKPRERKNRKESKHKESNRDTQRGKEQREKETVECSGAVLRG